MIIVPFFDNECDGNFISRSKILNYLFLLALGLSGIDL
jgi:hypothetical protein